MPSATVVMLKTIWVVVAFFTILRKHKAGTITATSTLRREPIKAIIRLKKGTRNATITEEMTSVVLSRMKHQKLLEILTGSSSLILLVNGFINRA